ncbi:MAG TPA: hypothetical protein PLJ84_01750 [Bacteroidales bacterium]|nr:hypothetical protein [Bacteroidales bacterium]
MPDHRDFIFLFNKLSRHFIAIYPFSFAVARLHCMALFNYIPQVRNPAWLPDYFSCSDDQE